MRVHVPTQRWWVEAPAANMQVQLAMPKVLRRLMSSTGPAGRHSLRSREAALGFMAHRPAPEGGVDEGRCDAIWHRRFLPRCLDRRQIIPRLKVVARIYRPKQTLGGDCTWTIASFKCKYASRASSCEQRFNLNHGRRLQAGVVKSEIVNHSIVFPWTKRSLVVGMSDLNLTPCGEAFLREKHFRFGVNDVEFHTSKVKVAKRCSVIIEPQ